MAVDNNQQLQQQLLKARGYYHLRWLGCQLQLLGPVLTALVSYKLWRDWLRIPGETWAVLKSKTRRAQLLRCCLVLAGWGPGGGGDAGGGGVPGYNKRGAEYANGVQSCAGGVWFFASNSWLGRVIDLRVFRTGFGLWQGAGGRAGVKVKAAGVGGDEGLSWAERGEQMPSGEKERARQ